MLTSDEKASLDEGLKEGHVEFRFEGRSQGKVLLWVHVDAKSDGKTWSVSVKMGDGSEMITVVKPESIELRLEQLLEEIKDHFEERQLKLN